MIIWINGAFGAGKTTISYELHRRISNSFVYDPENIGYFIRKHAPKSILKSDFQDHRMWREMNYSMLHSIANEYSGIIIVPMTVVNPQYFAEMITKLRDDNIDVKHFTLLANRETLLRRLKKRGDHQSSWPAQQIDRCIASLSQDLFCTHIHTDQLTPDDIIAFIATECDIDLLPDNRGMLQKKIDHLLTTIKHIRW